MFSFYPANREPKARPVVETGPGITKQAHKDEVDVNRIMRKYVKTGLMEFVENNELKYMDAPDIDYQEAMEFMRKSQETFLEMPSEIRKKFRNDPALFVDFASDPANRDEMVAMGLATAAEQSEPATKPPAETVAESPEAT